MIGTKDYTDYLTFLKNSYAPRPNCVGTNIAGETVEGYRTVGGGGGEMAPVPSVHDALCAGILIISWAWRKLVV